MKNSNTNNPKEEYIRDEYDFDYSKGIVGKYSRLTTEDNGYIKLTPELQKFFKTSEEVNNALRAVISAIPKSHKRAEKIV